MQLTTLTLLEYNITGRHHESLQIVALHGLLRLLQELLLEPILGICHLYALSFKA